jgi:hypothetical protein
VRKSRGEQAVRQNNKESAARALLDLRICLGASAS